MMKQNVRVFGLHYLFGFVYQKNAIGIVGWAECDSKIQNHQMIAGLKMAATA